MRALAWGPSILLMVTLTYLSSKSHLGADMGFPYQDKVLHFLAYAALGCTAAFALRVNNPHWSSLRLIVIATLVASLFGVMDELHQSTVPGRDASLGDALADFLGAASGAWILSRFEQTRWGRVIFSRIFPSPNAPEPLETS